LDAMAKQWRADSGLSLHFYGHFSPYFRDRTADGTDNKQTIQLCAPYYSFLWAEGRRGPAFLKNSAFRRLVDGLMVALYVTHAACMPIIDALKHFNEPLWRALTPTQFLAPVTIRLMRYQRDSYYYMNPHLDKSG